MYRALLGLILAVSLLSPLSARAEGRSIIVLDASGSMWGQIDGRTKIDIAREALAGVVKDLPPDTEMGLMAYGHREKGSCEDIELIVPPGKGNGEAIIAAASGLEFKGKTPLTESVRRAAEALRSTEEKATVILITDGIETCQADPCALGAELEASGVDFTAHVVGFGLSAEEGKKVACLAETTGGTYVAADDLASLATALETTVIVAAEPEPAPEPPAPAALEENVDPVLLMAEGGSEPEQVLLQDAVFEFFPEGSETAVATIYGTSKGKVAAGSYRMRASLHEAVAEAPVTIGPETDLSQPTVVLDAGILKLQLVSAEGADPEKEALWEMRGPDDIYDSGYATALRVFPSGEYGLTAALGEVKASESVVIEAGKVTDKTLILSAAIPVFTAYYREGMPVEGDQTFEVFAATKALDGSRPQIRTDYGAGAAPQLPPGDYVVVASVGPAVAEVPFSLKAGERKDVPVVLNAGIAAITAPNATAIEIFQAKPALDGRRPHVFTDYRAETQPVLTAGEYVALITSGEAKAEFPFTVKAGERTEVQAKVAVGMAAISAPGATMIAVVSAKPALDGSRETFHVMYRDTTEVMLPPGDYLVQVEADHAKAEQPITVKPDERLEVKIAVSAGSVEVTAPGAKSVQIVAAKADMQGNRESFGTDYRDAVSAVLAPGDYVAITEYDGGTPRETPFTIRNGEAIRLEVPAP